MAWCKESKAKAGDQMGAYTLIERLGKKGKSILWRCRCHCGREYERTVSNLQASLNSFGCRKCSNRSSNAKELTVGSTVGDLIILDAIRDPESPASVRWLCTCSVCGGEALWRGRDVLVWKRDGKTGCRSCQALRDEEADARNALHFSYQDPVGLQIQHLYLHGLRVPAAL